MGHGEGRGSGQSRDRHAGALRRTAGGNVLKTHVGIASVLRMYRGGAVISERLMGFAGGHRSFAAGALRPTSRVCACGRGSGRGLANENASDDMEMDCTGFIWVNLTRSLSKDADPSPKVSPAETSAEAGSIQYRAPSENRLMIWARLDTVSVNFSFGR